MTKLRRFSSALAFLGAFVFLFPLGYVPTDTPLYAIILVTVAMSFLGCNCSGFLTAAIELAPHYSGIIIGINNTFGSTAGFIAQLINRELIKHHVNSIELTWLTVRFLLCRGYLLAGDTPI